MFDFDKNSLLCEGGKAIESAKPIRGDVAGEIASDVMSKLESRFPDVGMRTAGSTGKKGSDDLSGDVDIIIALSPDRIGEVEKVLAELWPGCETRVMKGLNILSFGYPNDGGKAQVDLMFYEDLDLASFFYWSPDFIKDESEFKGVFRNFLIFSILKNIPVQGHVSTTFDNGHLKDFYKYVLRPDRGLVIVHQTFEGKKGTEIKTKRTIAEDTEDVTSDVKAIVSMMFGKGADIDDCNSVESLVDVIESEGFPYSSHRENIYRDFLGYVRDTQTAEDLDRVRDFLSSKGVEATEDGDISESFARGTRGKKAEDVTADVDFDLEGLFIETFDNLAEEDGDYGSFVKKQRCDVLVRTKGNGNRTLYGKRNLVVSEERAREVMSKLMANGDFSLYDIYPSARIDYSIGDLVSGNDGLEALPRWFTFDRLPGCAPSIGFQGGVRDSVGRWGNMDFKFVWPMSCYSDESRKLLQLLFLEAAGEVLYESFARGTRGKKAEDVSKGADFDPVSVIRDFVRENGTLYPGGGFFMQKLDGTAENAAGYYIDGAGAELPPMTEEECAEFIATFMREDSGLLVGRKFAGKRDILRHLDRFEANYGREAEIRLKYIEFFSYTADGSLDFIQFSVDIENDLDIRVPRFRNFIFAGDKDEFSDALLGVMARICGRRRQTLSESFGRGARGKKATEVTDRTGFELRDPDDFVEILISRFFKPNGFEIRKVDNGKERRAAEDLAGNGVDGVDGIYDRSGSLYPYFNKSENGEIRMLYTSFINIGWVDLVGFCLEILFQRRPDTDWGVRMTLYLEGVAATDLDFSFGLSQPLFCGYNWKNYYGLKDSLEPMLCVLEKIYAWCTDSKNSSFFNYDCESLADVVRADAFDLSAIYPYLEFFVRCKIDEAREELEADGTETDDDLDY